MNSSNEVLAENGIKMNNSKTKQMVISGGKKEIQISFGWRIDRKVKQISVFGDYARRLRKT